MLRKILLSLFLFLSFFTSLFALTKNELLKDIYSLELRLEEIRSDYNDKANKLPGRVYKELNSDYAEMLDIANAAIWEAETDLYNARNSANTQEPDSASSDYYAAANSMDTARDKVDKIIYVDPNESESSSSSGDSSSSSSSDLPSSSSDSWTSSDPDTTKTEDQTTDQQTETTWTTTEKTQEETETTPTQQEPEPVDTTTEQNAVNDAQNNVDNAQEEVNKAQEELNKASETEEIKNLKEAQKAYEKWTPAYNAVQTEIDNKLKAETDALNNANTQLSNANTQLSEASTDLANSLMEWSLKQQMQWAQMLAEKALEKDSTCSKPPCQAAQEKAQKAKDAYDGSTESKNDITSRGFSISVNDLTPGLDVKGKTTKENVNYALWTIIQKMMMALWSLALLIMTIWGWYIVLHHWQDELLSKWKSIFMSWVYALVVALGSYYLVAILRYILFN